MKRKVVCFDNEIFNFEDAKDFLRENLAKERLKTKRVTRNAAIADREIVNTINRIISALFFLLLIFNIRDKKNKKEN